jgi:hypothetical protein
MPNDTAIESLMEVCVKAGLAARHAQACLLALEARHPKVNASELAQARVEADRLSRAYVDSQGPLYEAGPALFRAHLAEVQRRINERLL